MTAADPLRDKAQLRKTLRRARMALPRAYRQQAARAIARHASRLLRRGKHLGAYIAAGSELDRKVLADMAVFDKVAFSSLVAQAKASLA